MATPRIKIFDADGKYQASTHDYAAAACLMGLYGDGATVRLGHSPKDTIWVEGEGGEYAANCYDLIADAIEGYDAAAQKNLARILSGSA